ncbi:hypothetical protein E6P09_01125 [Haloferax mediterranei ATCC 33500]|uniref:Zinc finger FPG/IleRS-type domain-containing protein n=1 Tax=Haloferax mediterranei (strain ATCC 33500 / DSM 1411 / JCM 8866 / NBRC 14739 / NCIMB 2177 / R-4) TaxID=523841 RepID=I3R6E4_HALMT|nr:zinc finger domain-containing protein [Haloferax mediterranei]AFK19804.1 hypothetical protein HFX_2113 [Haloferax mediterranei ATCC 33500]QCQ73950.1 hypothetical protein E6P09_01125 [Haloferax mediterranei ATCC 33500]
MPCPRCSQHLSTLAFDGHAALYCERCGFADIEASHERDAPASESWDDAITRFRKQAAETRCDGGDDC